MNWNNIDLTSAYEVSQDILDGYSSETLLLEVQCNCPVINRETVRKQALYEIELKRKVAIEILEANLDNYVNAALKNRNAG
jgi:hypothetical protein